MGLVKRLTCEKKMDYLPDIKYETENDSDSASSSDFDNAAKNDKKQISKRKTKHRWFHFFKSNKPSNNSNDTLWDDVVANNHSSLAIVSANHFAKFLDNKAVTRAAILHDINNPTTTVPVEINNPTTVPVTVIKCPRNTIIKSTKNTPEEYWQNKIVPKFSADQRDLLAESLFSHIWETQGESLASKIFKDYDTANLHYIADDHFDQGCQLWAGDDAEGAHSEFERSRRIREVQATQKSLLHVQHLQDKEGSIINNNNTNNNINNNNQNQNAEGGTESDAELFFALGMVQRGRLDNYASLKEFRRAMQVSALGLGMNHELTKASLYMIRSTYLAMRQTAREIQHNISQLTTDLHHEIEGDQLYEAGKKEQALVEYANLKLLYDSDSMVQARIKTKMATIFEEKKDYSKAMDLWADLLVLYEDTPSLGLHHPLARHALAKVVGARRKLQPWTEI